MNWQGICIVGSLVDRVRISNPLNPGVSGYAIPCDICSETLQREVFTQIGFTDPVVGQHIVRGA
jgi:hypothetical protein